MSTALPTQNEAWGFYGTIAQAGHGTSVTLPLWTIATDVIRRETGASDETIRAFLDSKHGRHFADDVVSNLQQDQTLTNAVQLAADRWMGLRISRRTSEHTGIPQGLPYLTGFVEHEGIVAEETEVGHLDGDDFDASER
jgi:hypothetical protein